MGTSFIRFKYRTLNQVKKLVSSIRISDETLTKLHKIKGEIEALSGQHTSMDDAINEIIKAYKRRK